jgi:hypothetical protein
MYLVGHSLGYFIYDTIYAEYYGVHDMAMRLHHAGAIVGTTAVYF